MKHIIYKITSKITGKSYIGLSSSTLKERWRLHIVSSKQTNNIHFYNAIRKYGVDEWDLEVIYHCQDLTEARLQETNYITEYDTYNNGYNSTLGGEGKRGPLSKETKLKISRSKLGKSNPKIGGENHWMKKVTSEVKEKWLDEHLRGKNNPMYDKTFTSEQLEKMIKRGAENGSAKKFKFTSPEGQEFHVHGEFIKFCEYHNLTLITMRSALKFSRIPNRGSAKGWKVEYD